MKESGDPQLCCLTAWMDFFAIKHKWKKNKQLLSSGTQPGTNVRVGDVSMAKASSPTGGDAGMKISLIKLYIEKRCLFLSISSAAIKQRSATCISQWNHRVATDTSNLRSMSKLSGEYKVFCGQYNWNVSPYLYCITLRIHTTYQHKTTILHTNIFKVSNIYFLIKSPSLTCSLHPLLTSPARCQFSISCHLNVQFQNDLKQIYDNLILKYFPVC